ncbi:MAG TPA: dephospho-CoA kinase, partial [Bryobacteraceae bacterium]|nr:dephospho-CoA kinase [Bryobacteraceae bacterium]
MLRVGLTGGLASGKSFVGEELARLGCHVIQADQLGHEALEQGGEAYAAVLREFGPQVADAGGAIDRQRLAAEVFDRPERLERLNHLVHPAVIRREEELLREIEAGDPSAIAVVEAAILIESGSSGRFDKLIVVVCTREQQIERAVHRGLTREEALARLERQMPLDQKRRYADFLIDTSGTKEETSRQVGEVYRELRSI